MTTIYSNWSKKKVASKKFKTQVKVETLGHYSEGVPRCKRCGIEDLRVLTLDHINSDGAQSRRAKAGGYGGTNYYVALRRLNYPSGYQVLCQNCHRIVEHERGGWDNIPLEYKTSPETSEDKLNKMAEYLKSVPIGQPKRDIDGKSAALFNVSSRTTRAWRRALEKQKLLGNIQFNTGSGSAGK